MKKILILLLIFTCFSCYKVEDETENTCSSNCTLLQGRIITMNDQGIPGIKISLDYIKSTGTYSMSVRKIAEIVTDQNGNFHKNFYIKDEELGNSAIGYFKIRIDDSNLDVNKFILFDNKNITPRAPFDFAIYSINSRDTIIGNTYYLPKKAYIKVNLNNFIPIQDRDYFEVRTLYPFGPKIGNNNLLDTEYSTGSSGYGKFMADGLNTQLNVFVAENEQNIIRIARRKDGVNTIEDFPVIVPSNNSIELTYDY